MSKAGKRGKSAQGQAGGAKWEQALLATPLEEDKWRPNITFVVGHKTDDSAWIDTLCTTVSTGIRKLFGVITREQLYNEVRDLGNPKAKKAKDVPQHYEVCEPCKTHLDNGEDIPLPLLAKLLKYKLLALKTTDLKRRDVERKAASDKDKPKKGGDKGGKDRAKSPGKGKGGKKTPEPPSAKEGSKLRKRGEEDPDSKYIDDEPDDGAHFYVLIHGFHSPHIFVQLAELGINIDCILRITSQDYSRFDPPPTTDEHPPEKDEKTLAIEEAANTEKQKFKKELHVFWRDVIPLLQRQPEASKLHDIPRKEYIVKSLLVPENLEDNEQKNNFGLAMFEDIACMVYDLIDAKRHYQAYLDNLNLIHIPVQSEPPSPPPEGEKSGPVSGAPTPAAQTGAPPPPLQEDKLELPPQVDMRYYNDLMNCVPQESMSTALIMHCMLEQVVATEENRDPPSEQLPPRREDGLNTELASHISSVAFKLALTEDEHNMLADVFDLPERPPDTPKQPVLMNFHDGVSMRTQHLQPFEGFSPLETEKEMLEKLPFHKLMDLPRPTSAVARERSARLQEMIHFCATGGLSQAEIDRAFKQFVFESMDLSTTDPNGFIITRDIEGVHHSAIPWDDPYPFFKGMIPKHEKSEMELPPPSPRSEERSGAASPTPDDKSQDNRVTTPSEKSVSPDDRAGSRPTSGDSRKGILRPPSRAGSLSPHGKRSRSNSVHFEKDEEGHPLPIHTDDEEQEDEEPEKTTDESMNEVVDAQKRILDQWCFAEHYEPHILLQVLKEASYTLPFVDTYYHKRDHSMLVVLHSPYSAELQSHVDWHTELHSNVGFRNYLEYVADSVADWLKEEDAKYHAQILSAELEKVRLDEEAAAKAAEKAKGRAKSPKKSPTRSAKSPKGSRSSSPRASSAGSDPFVRENSLKAWKLEQDRLKEEEDEKERVKSAKRTRSKSPKKKDEKDDKEKEKKRPGSRSSAKSKGSQKEPEQEQPQEQEPQEPERYWPFTGYDVGNSLIHVSGVTSTLFPSDGGQIRTERTEFVQGTTSVKVTVLKDRHIFAVHILNPKEPTDESDDEEDGEEKKDEPEKSETEKSEKDDAESKDVEGSTEKKSISVASDGKKPSVSAYGSITAHLGDGMTLALSQFGPTGEAEDGKKPEPEPYVPPPTSPSPAPLPTSPSKSKKGEKGKAVTPEPVPPPPEEDEETEEEKKDEEKVPEQPFQQLFVTCPDGLNVKYMLESSCGMKPLSDDDRRLLVKQSYPFKTKGVQPCEASRKKYALSEESRIITSEGAVIKNMVDGSVEVLYADATVSRHTGPWPTVSSRSSSPQRLGSAKSQTGDRETPTKKDKGRAGGKAGGKGVAEKPTDSQTDEEEKKSVWVTTFPNGEKLMYKADGQTEEQKPVMISMASDPETNQSMATRDDHVMTISYPDGTTIVEHADGTRITTYYRPSQVAVSGDDTSETGEIREYENQMLKFVKIECPAYATVEFNCMTSENLTTFGNGTTINVFPDGYYMLHHFDGGRLEVDTEGTATYYPRPNKNMEQLLPERELQYVLRHNADVIVETVDTDNNVFNVKYNGDINVMPSNGDEVSETSSDDQSKSDRKIMHYKEHSPRFFIIHSDLSGTELLRYQSVADYLTTAEQSSATAVLKDELPDFPGVLGITILKPYLGGPSERWLKHYDHESIIPSGIRCRDLTTLPPKEYKTDGPQFGNNVGQGLSVGAAVRSPIRIPILKCPSVLELRQLIQYKPVSEAQRSQFQAGLREYAEYVKARNLAADMMQVQDPRTEEEKINASDLQSLAMTKKQEAPQYEPADVKVIYEKATAPPVPSPPPTPQPKRTRADWERDQREVAEETEGRLSLKNRNIPKYFESEFGKAFLLSQAKDISEMVQHLSDDPRKDGTEAVRSSPSQTGALSSDHQTQSGAAVTSHSDRSSSSSPPGNPLYKAAVPDTPVSYAVYSEATPSRTGLRPGNPTPAHATGQGSPAPVRPQNPTPAHALKNISGRPVNPTPKQAGGAQVESPSDLPSQVDHPIIMEQPREEEDFDDEQTGESDLVLTRSLKMNVVGEPRNESVPLPAGILGGRPGAIPNTKFQAVEDPVRRRVRNSVVAGATVKGQTQLIQMRGLNLLPEEADFGVLKEGHTYAFSVFLKNTGVDSCRFKVKQPPPATGLRVLYKPGPVAAGMKSELNVEIYAIAVGVEGDSGVGYIRHELEIVTETDILFLPITATVLTAFEYDSRSPNSPQGGKSPGTRLVSTKPPSTMGIIRPRKEFISPRPSGTASTYV